jgi:hypothetical protein
MEIDESFFGKNHGKLAHLRNLAPKIIYVSAMMTTPTPDPCHELAPSKVLDHTCECSSSFSGTKGIGVSGISESMYMPKSVSCAS